MVHVLLNHPRHCLSRNWCPSVLLIVCTVFCQAEKIKTCYALDRYTQARPRTALLLMIANSVYALENQHTMFWLHLLSIFNAFAQNMGSPCQHPPKFLYIPTEVLQHRRTSFPSSTISLAVSLLSQNKGMQLLLPFKDLLKRGSRHQLTSTLESLR